MRQPDEADTFAAHGRAGLEVLGGVRGLGFEAALVERVGHEGVDRRMQPVRRLEEQAAIRGDRPCAVQQVLEAEASAPSGWVPCETCGSWLGSPSRTSERAEPATEHTVARDSWPASSTNRTSTASAMSSRAHNQLVPPTTWNSPLAKPAATFSFDETRSTSSWGDASSVSPASWTIRTESPPQGGVRHSIEEVGDHAMRLGDDADSLAPLDERKRHAGSGVGLARAGRPLDRQHAVVERDDEPAGGVERSLAGMDERRALGLERRTRRAAQDQIAGGTIRPGSGQPATDDGIGHAPERTTHRLGPVRLRWDQATRVGATWTSLQVDRARNGSNPTISPAPSPVAGSIGLLPTWSLVSCAGSNR